jgi:ArsR family transcriptional regulator, arsenate/arsenite/antimonite-responsive transcriptional repressor
MMVNAKDAIEALGALAHEHRLGIYRLLVQHGPVGMPAGRIATKVGLVPSSLTFHLQALQRAGLISQRRESRQLIYSADFDVMNGVVGYLTENCCAGSGECAPPPAIRGQPPHAMVVELLEAAGLPTADVSQELLRHFFYLPCAGSAAGLVGLELYGHEALLRSLVVRESERGKGLGIALVHHAESYAASHGVRSMYLLTLTAQPLFERLGYTHLDRSAAPTSIQRTSEFANLCPASSAFMVKVL